MRVCLHGFFMSESAALYGCSCYPCCALLNRLSCFLARFCWSFYGVISVQLIANISKIFLRFKKQHSVSKPHWRSDCHLCNITEVIKSSVKIWRAQINPCGGKKITGSWEGKPEWQGEEASQLHASTDLEYVLDVTSSEYFFASIEIKCSFNFSNYRFSLCFLFICDKQKCMFVLFYFRARPSPLLNRRDSRLLLIMTAQMKS